MLSNNSMEFLGRDVLKEADSLEFLGTNLLKEHDSLDNT